MDLSHFKRLPHYLQHLPLEFGQLIQEQHPVVCQGDLSQLRGAPAADDGYV
jgi:hypothetical protein